MRPGIAGAAILLAVAAPAATAGEAAFSHADAFEHYEGTRTCLECHEDEATSFFHSQHYQWRGDAPAIVNSGGKKLGKLNTINDFCTSPLPSWIGEIRNGQGTVVSQGCSKCHSGFGLVPAEEASAEQFENIDCLICHASGYRRDLYPKEGGGWEWKSILWKNREGLDSVSKRLGPPTRKTCLRCHSGAGGGPNYKRGDVEYALVECDSTFDVHMAVAGHDMQCIACHRGDDHRVRGRGADLSGTDSPEAPLSCSTAECHGEAPHGNAMLDRHTARVACNACHIPEFAKGDPTDMKRDWSVPVRDPETGKYSATITLESHVRPVYAWFNGKTREQLLGEPVAPEPDGTVAIMKPQGDRSDPAARITPFKLHHGRLPVLKDERWLVPIAVEKFFADGNLDEAVNEACKVTYGRDTGGYEWVDTMRYMSINHQVGPKDRALKCADCHSDNGRMDWKALGYEGDPRRAKRK